jgi:hypothetical protein
MPRKKDIRKELVEQTGDESLLFADGFDSCIIGVWSFNDILRVVYDEDEVIRTLMKRDKMSHEEAHEFFEFNIRSAYVGPKTPYFTRTITE